ncbi:MAG TPA: sulfotransferase [Polyangiaceae bacterium]|nr:sulfotransferase [Polyangiaceae bacterium]
MSKDVIPSVAQVSAEYAKCQDKEALEQVQTYGTFIGYPYSGHSLVGSLLDAHPNMIFAHELHALSYIRAGFTQQLLFYSLLENSRAFTAEGRTWNGYQYSVPNQWHGRYRELRVIGDKKGGGTSREFGTNPEMLQALSNAVPIRKKFIHVIRNPFDNISTISKRMFPVRNSAAGFYFSLATSVASMMSRVPKEDIFHLKHEDFVARPKQLLTELCRFLGEEVSSDYLDDCASIVREAPNKSRLTVEWTAEQKQKVQRHIDNFSFLAGYNFDG